MSEKVDLDKIEEKARAAAHECLNTVRWFSVDTRTVAWSPTIDGRDTCVPQSYADTFDDRDTSYIEATTPPITLALIARIRELEIALGEACGDMPDGGQHDRLYGVLARGTVLP